MVFPFDMRVHPKRQLSEFARACANRSEVMRTVLACFGQTVDVGWRMLVECTQMG